MDRIGADFFRTVRDDRGPPRVGAGRHPAARSASEGHFKGVIDLIADEGPRVGRVQGQGRALRRGRHPRRVRGARPRSGGPSCSTSWPAEDDDLMEKYLGDEELTDAEIKRGHPQGHARRSASCPCCAARRSRTRACSPCSTPWSTSCRQPARHPAGPGHGHEGHRGPRAPGRRDGAVRRAGLQDRGRPLRQAHVLPGLLGHASRRAPRSTTPPRTARSGWAASC